LEVYILLPQQKLCWGYFDFAIEMISCLVHI